MIKYFDLNYPLFKLSTDKIRVEYRKVSCENVSIKMQLLNLEEQLDIVNNKNESLLKEKETLEKNLKEKNILFNSTRKNSTNKKCLDNNNFKNKYNENTNPNLKNDSDHRGKQR